MDPKADVDIMYDIREFKRERKKYLRNGQYLHAIVCEIFVSRKVAIKALLYKMCGAISYFYPCYKFMQRLNVYLPGADVVTGENALGKKKQN